MALGLHPRESVLVRGPPAVTVKALSAAASEFRHMANSHNGL